MSLYVRSVRHSLQTNLCLILMFTLLSIKNSNAATLTPHDPTQPVVTDIVVKGAKKTSEPTYILQSIIISPTRQLALINSKFVGVGDKIDDAIVKNIEKDSVVLTLSGRTLTLYLFEHSNWE